MVFSWRRTKFRFHTSSTRKLNIVDPPIVTVIGKAFPHRAFSERSIETVRSSNLFGRVFRPLLLLLLRDLNLNSSLKIWPDLRVFFIADPADPFQIIRVSERPRGNNARRHDVSYPRHFRQLFFSRSVDVDLSERRLFLCMRFVRLDRTAAQNRRDRLLDWRSNGR